MNADLVALPGGHRLQEYELLRVLGVGGFGITYLAFDHNLDKAVAVKEYLPRDLATRTTGNSVAPQTSRDKENFEWGLERFLEEARMLAKFDHPSIARIYRFFPSHGTAYIVMEYVEGETLADLLTREQRIGETQLKRVLMPILDGLEQVHRSGVLHRDIKPGNIMIRADGGPVLLDFGAARQALGAKSRSVTSIVTPGYAPIEQYSTRGNQGPWTDIYALGAVCYRCVSGELPPDATERMRRDPLEPVVQAAADVATRPFLEAVDWALAVDEDARPQSLDAWRAALRGDGTGGPTAAPAISAATAALNTGARPTKPFRSRVGVVAFAAVVAMLAAAYWLFGPRSTGSSDGDAVADAAEPALSRVVPDATRASEQPPRSAVNETQNATAVQAEPVASADVGANAAAPDATESTEPQLMSFDQVFFSPSFRGAALEADAAAGLAALRAGRDPAEVGDRTPLRESYEDAPPDQVIVLFGAEIYAALAAAEPGQWVGPFRSDFGLHVVRVRTNASRAEAETARQARVELARREAEEAELREEQAREAERQRLAQEAAELERAERQRVAEAAELERARQATAASTPCSAELVNTRRPFCRDVLRSGGEGPALVVLPMGSFLMGSDEPDESPQHTVVIDQPFAISVNEISFAEFNVYCTRAGKRCPENPWSSDDYPVVNVSWDDAQGYAHWLAEETGRDYGLPSEAMWEYAARAGTSTPYPFGDVITPAAARSSALGPVGSPLPNSDRSVNRNNFRLMHMIGNVREWVFDDWAPGYVGAPAGGRARFRGGVEIAVIRGGSYADGAFASRSAARAPLPRGHRDRVTGFRLWARL